MDQHTGGKWLIHGTKHLKDNQLQNQLSRQEYKFYHWPKNILNESYDDMI